MPIVTNYPVLVTKAQELESKIEPVTGVRSLHIEKDQQDATDTRVESNRHWQEILAQVLTSIPLYQPLENKAMLVPLMYALW